MIWLDVGRQRSRSKQSDEVAKTSTSTLGISRPSYILITQLLFCCENLTQTRTNANRQSGLELIYISHNLPIIYNTSIIKQKSVKNITRITTVYYKFTVKETYENLPTKSLPNNFFTIMFIKVCNSMYYKNLSGDEIANVNFYTTISHTYFKIPKNRTYFV